MRGPATVYIPNLNGGHRLLSTLVSLHAQSIAPRVVVVDNGSSDGSPDQAEDQFPDVSVVRLQSNQGFGRALNRAVELHPADLLVFLNNDIRCEPRFIEALLEQAGNGAVAGVLLQAQDPGTIDSAGVVADLTLLAFDYLHGEPVRAASGAPPPLGPTGGAALVSLDAFRRVRGFDERIFAYLEDVDLAVRLRREGIECRLAPDARAVHEHSATLGSGSAAKNALMGFSRGYLLRRYGVLRAPRRGGRALVCEAVLCGGQMLIDHTTSGLAGRVRGWRAAGGLPRRALPDGELLQLPLRDALRARAKRRLEKQRPA